MQKHFFCLVIFSLILMHIFVPWSAKAQDITISANNAILMDQSTGNVLYEKGMDEKQEIASITKIMTAIIAIESGQMKQKTKISRRAIHTEGSAIYLEQGEKMTVNDLVYGLMLRSGNDAAVAISEQIGGSVEGFVYLMNEKAKWIGMTNTNFSNPHGLSEENHYSTAYDMALLMQYAMKNDMFKEISGTKSYKAETKTYPWQNKNKLLTVYDDRCTGGKTGFTKSSGRTLITTASHQNKDLIVVTLNAPDDWQDHIALYNHGFATLNKTHNTASMNGQHDTFLDLLMEAYHKISGVGYSD